ncbi:MAG: DUF4330 family protein [Lachnospirales bacterium]
MLDKKGRLFGKVSIVDLAIIILLIVLIIGVAIRFSSKGETITSNDDFKIVFEIDKVRQYTVDAIKVGDDIYEQHGNILGTVSNIEIEPGYDVMTKDNGTALYAPVEDRYRLIVTMDSSGNVNEFGYFANGNRQISTGSDLAIQSQYIHTYCRILDVYE